MISKRSAKAFCKDDISLIENYDKAISDTTQLWHCHHRRETIYSRQELKEIGEYYNRPACELIFLTPLEHHRLHNLGKSLSAETRKKFSEVKKGENNPFFGKHHSAETRKKISEANKGKQHSAEARKKMSEVHKGKHLSAEACKKIAEARKCKPLSAETRKKISEALKGKPTCIKGKHWYNNGVKNILAKTCPEGFVPGRIVCNKRS